MSESIQHKLDRVRTPRVHITYDVETAGAIEKKELPFVIGIMSDLSGMPREGAEIVPLVNKKFVEIDRDNLNDVMKSIKPYVRIAPAEKSEEEETEEVELKEGEANELSEKPEKKKEYQSFLTELNFESMADFNPLNIVKKVPELKALYDSRYRLKDILTKMDGNPKLEQMLANIIKDGGFKSKLHSQIDSRIKEIEAEEEKNKPVEETEEKTKKAKPKKKKK